MPFLNRKYLISLFYTAIVTVGIAMWIDIPKELAPELHTPSVTISYYWGRTSPEVMEQEITRKVEQAARQLRDVRNIRSSTQEGRASITLNFHPDTEVDFRIVELQEYLYQLRDQLPDDVQQPSISRRVPEEIQEMQNFLMYSLSGTTNSHDLLEFAERNIRLPLSGLNGLAEVEIHGVREPALMIAFDKKKLEDHQMQPWQMMNQIRENLNWRSGGFTDDGHARYNIQVPPSFTDIDQIREMPLSLPSGRRILLSQIAEVSVQDYPAKQITRINGSPALTISFIKEGGFDTMALAAEINSRMEAIIAELPDELYIQLEYDATEDLRAQLTSLEKQALISLICVFVVLLLFIRKVRAPLIILGSILFSLLLSVMALYLMGYTLNIITLAGLTISLGLIIDNAVVVFEHLNPKLPAGRSNRIVHISKEIKHVLVPVFGATFTTVGIFIPILFAMEAVRIFLAPLAVAITTTLIASIIVSLSWIPYALVWLVHPDRKSNGEVSSKISNKSKSRFGFSLNRLMIRYFHWRRKLRYVLIAGCVLLIGIPVFLIPEPDEEESTEQVDVEDPAWYRAASWYFPNRDAIDPWIGGVAYRFAQNVYFGERWIRPQTETLTVTIRTPLGTPLEEIDKIARNFENIAVPYRDHMRYFETHVSEYSISRIIFHFDQEQLFQSEPYILFAEASFLAARTGNVVISVSGFGESFTSGFGGGGSGFNITLRGFSYDELEETAIRLKQRLEQNPRVRDVNTNKSSPWQRDDLYHYVMKPDKDVLISKSLRNFDVYQSIMMEANPTNTFGRVEFNGRPMYLMASHTTGDRYREQFEQDLRTAGVSSLFRISEIADLSQQHVLPDIRRENQTYVRVVTYDFLGPWRFGAQFQESVLKDFALPLGVTAETDRNFFGFGSQEETYSMLIILLFALLAVWMIVSALLEHWSDAMFVLLAIPLSALGIMAGALYHDLYFDRSALAGALLCAGVVVNNAILLMHGRKAMRVRNISGFRAWVHIYREKMRPVLITTLTTLGGLLPLVFMESSDFWQTLATVVCWGLLSSTFFLIVLMGIWEKPYQSKEELGTSPQPSPKERG